jgi:hypothetical protein
VGEYASTRIALLRGLMIGNDVLQVPMEKDKTALVPFLVPTFSVPSSRLF